MSDVGENDAEGRGSARSAMRRTDGELILLWTLPASAIIWISAFLLFPGFTPPMSPTMPAEQVAAFYRENQSGIRYSMILFNWFCVGLIPVLILIVMQIRRMAHRTPIFSYCMLGCVAGGPTLFLVANVCWLLAAFRPERNPELTQMFNDFAWITFTSEVPFLIAQSVILALAIYFNDRRTRYSNAGWPISIFSSRPRWCPRRSSGWPWLGPWRGTEHCLSAQEHFHRGVDPRDGRRSRPGGLSGARRVLCNAPKNGSSYERIGDADGVPARGAPGFRCITGSPGIAGITRSASCGWPGGRSSSSTTSSSSCSS